jgi:hypothetical protein
MSDPVTKQLQFTNQKCKFSQICTDSRAWWLLSVIYLSWLYDMGLGFSKKMEATRSHQNPANSSAPYLVVHVVHIPYDRARATTGAYQRQIDPE